MPSDELAQTDEATIEITRAEPPAEPLDEAATVAQDEPEEQE